MRFQPSNLKIKIKPLEESELSTTLHNIERAIKHKSQVKKLAEGTLTITSDCLAKKLNNLISMLSFQEQVLMQVFIISHLMILQQPNENCTINAYICCS